MRHPIDPKIDCVFKALLGSEENRNLLVHFLNAILGADLAAPVVDVDILNPYNEKDFDGDKLSVVDVKARDREGRQFQAEIQMRAYPHLQQRMSFTWCDLHQSQLGEGDGYALLRPTYSIWLLGEKLIQADSHYARDYQLRDRQGRPLGGNGGIYLLELPKFAAERVETAEQRWLKFFKEGASLDEAALPEWMGTAEMRQAMSTLKRFSEQEENYHRYRARLDYQREQETIRWEYEQSLAQLAEERAAKEQERAAKEAALQREEQEREAKQLALAEIERLKALLAGKQPH
jgi:predicted transposase/invertase (TIGR01784 family)